MQIAGSASPPGRSVAVEVTLDVSGDAVQLRDGKGDVWRSAALAELTFDAPLGRLDRKITFPDGVLFQTPDHAGLDAIFGHRTGDILHATERMHPRLIAVVVGCLLGFAAIWRFGLPALVAVAVWGTPDVLLRQMDSGTLLTLDKLVLAPSTLTQNHQSQVIDIHARLREQIDPDDLPSRTLLFRNAGAAVGPNAFALPGGTIVVTDALTRLLDDDPEAIAGVLAHELTHVTEDHGITALYRSLALYVVIGLLAGDTGPLLDEVLLEGNALLSLKGSRDAERDADAGAVRILQAAGYDPDGLARFFDLIGQLAGPDGGWISTHPGSAERSETIRAMIR